jgi:hypothetical protein
MRLLTISLLLLLSLSLNAQLQKGGKYFNSSAANFEGLTPPDYLTNNAELGGASLYLSSPFEELSFLATPEYGVFASNVALELGPNLRYFADDESYRVGFDIGLQYFINKMEGED